MIGTNAQETFGLPNGAGIEADEDGATIGGPGSAANTVAFNDGPGISVSFFMTALIAENSVFSNFGLGIDAGGQGVTPNDTGDSDGVQNFPVLSAAVASGSSTIVRGTIETAPNRALTLRFFSSPDCDPSGFGQGKTPLGSTTFTANGSGTATFEVELPHATTPGRSSSPRRRSAGSSEFSACEAITPPDRVGLAPATLRAPEGTTARLTVTRIGGLGISSSVQFTTRDGSGHAGVTTRPRKGR